MKQIALLKRHIGLVLVLVLALGGSAYAGSKIGGKDLKPTKARFNEKSVNPGKSKIVKAHCKSGERAIGGNYSVLEVPGNMPHPIEFIVSGAGLAQRNITSASAPTKRYTVNVTNVGTENPALVAVTVFCLKP